MSNIAATMQNPVYLSLPAEQRAQYLVWQKAMLDIDGRKRKRKACVEWSLRNGHIPGWSFPNVWKKYHAWKRDGRDCEVLFNKSYLPKGSLKKHSGLAGAFKYYCECNQRACSEGWRAMVRDLIRGVHIKGVGTWRDVWMEENPGLTPPGKCPYDFGHLPCGWRYRNMMRKYKPTKFELEVTRKGAVAARKYVPSVYTSRAGVQPGMIYMFDDMWHDVNVAFPGRAKELIRPLEFCALDYASTMKISWGLHARVSRDDGTRVNLNKAQTMAVVWDVLCNKGVHPDGGVFVIEHGTASLTEGEQALITELTGGLVTFRQSGLLGRQVLPGMLSGKGCGNFRIKALLEGSHRMPHYAAAALPAQTGGQARVDDPEQLYGIERYALKTLSAWDRIPEEHQLRIWHGGALTLEEYIRAVGYIYEDIYDRKTHKIEGWEKNGWTRQEWSMDGASGTWLPCSGIPQLPEKTQTFAMGQMQDPMHTRLRLMSPREVWERHAPGLTRFPIWFALPFLYNELYRTVRVGHDGIIRFRDQDMTGTRDEIRFYGVVKTPGGDEMPLDPGKEYGLYMIPHARDKAVIVRAGSKAVIGIACQWVSADPRDTGQLKTMMELQARAIAYQAAGVRERHADDSDAALVRKEQTDLILASLPKKARKGTGKAAGKGPAKKETRDAIDAVSKAFA